MSPEQAPEISDSARAAIARRYFSYIGFWFLGFIGYSIYAVKSSGTTRSLLGGILVALILAPMALNKKYRPFYLWFLIGAFIAFIALMQAQPYVLELKQKSGERLTLRSTRTLSLRASVLKQFSIRVPQQ
ncbi:hypothetical protein [Geothrix sp. PMB-07]|uniref:hypothetical protein n=1 Tax=Geothrix sp. PMB-07 TaxID=3068640 RepID=UPI002740F12D|nr:hypothetical protein [Geothrix sp. PMB-07]WLT30421.1 hypothetical protein Q9293_11895 [Geothrix sp. PMB-07]